MLERSWPGGRLFIGQPAHAWVSGQIARVWGNDTFGTFEPWEETCLAAAQHDIGMTELDLEPTLDPSTGGPHTFLDMPRPLHVGVWSRAPQLVLPQSRYAALLVSMHGTGLYGYVDVTDEPDTTKEMVETFLADQRAFQQDLIGALRADDHYGELASDRLLRRNLRLIQVWDLMSLRICMGFESEVVERVPAADGDLPLFMAAEDDGATVMLDPWPFQTDQVSIRCDGRILDGAYRDVVDLRSAMQKAPWVTLSFSLRPRR